jgi:hypothetical protein
MDAEPMAQEADFWKRMYRISCDRIAELEGELARERSNRRAAADQFDTLARRAEALAASMNRVEPRNG